MHVVALLAHPDDEISCGGTLARFVDDGHNVTLYTAFSDRRAHELHQSAKVLGVNLIERYAAQSTFAWNQDTVRLYDAQIAALEPDLLISHRVADNNTSHVPLARIIRTIARKNSTSLWEIDAAIPGGIETDSAANNHLVSIDDQVMRKYGALGCYESVLQNYPGIQDAFTHRDLHNGWLLQMSAEPHYAEAFRIIKSVWR